ncbi:hypothetical protein GRI89_07905 [Altererythrobacter salegens]|uniref:Uncharacterized protein n=1 Tax=Croceibacterium salegens TaxID=1737568 RepID=A0A6I4STV9_9SPHN|nr:hypothetical protein [Croceibacterium salegens]MXO59464.1 hypothetical protein [Croceibacterium salegens]
MRRVIVAAALATIPFGALAQDTAGDWGYFQPDGGTMQAGVVAADGSQLILKCDKPGQHKVFAVLVSTSNLAAPMSDDNYESTEVTLRMDENAPWTDNWRLNGNFAMAVDQGTTRSLTRLLEKLDKAEKFEIRLRPRRKSVIVVNFNTKGTRAAMERVYESCQDTVPFD